MREYTQTCADCESHRRFRGLPDARCTACETVFRLLGQFLKSRSNRLHAHALVVQAEEAAGCEQSLEMNALVAATWTRPQSFDQSDRPTA